MRNRRISIDQIVVGCPLEWDVYDAGGNLLLRKGWVVERIEQIEALIERGLFIGQETAPRKPEARPRTNDLLFAIGAINLAQQRLGNWLRSLPGAPGAREGILAVSDSVIEVATGHPDGALSTVTLNQHADDYPVRHSLDTAITVVLATRTMNLPPEQLKIIVAAALTMNVGMLQEQQQLHAKPGKLTDAETALIRNHPLRSVELLRQSGIDNPDWLEAVRLHHEREDGSGYPEGRMGSAIPLAAKIISLADRYCARVSSRPYRKSQQPNAALRELLLTDRKDIDPALIAIFIKELGTYPVGTIVRLENGEIGVVTARGASTTTPIVHALVGPRGAPFDTPIKRYSDRQPYAIRNVLHPDEVVLHISMRTLWDKLAGL